jgi:mRNA interferase RelE/StbE
VYEVLLERTAERDLKQLPSSQFLRIISQIKMLAHNPRPPGSRKLTGTDRDWRVRVGDYRILYEIDDKSKIIRVMRTRHRREVYR